MLPTVRFSPSEIARSVFECQEQVASVQTLGDATVCLYIYDSSKTQLGEFLAFDPLTFGCLLSDDLPSPTQVISGPLHLPCVPHSLAGDLKSSVTFDLALDPGRLSPRAIFEETKTQALSRVRILGLSKHCETVRLLLPVSRL